MEPIVAKKESNTQFCYLLEELLKTSIVPHERMNVNDSDFNDKWIEEHSFRVNTCFSNTDSYLAERQDDPVSSLVHRYNSLYDGGYSGKHWLCLMAKRVNVEFVSKFHDLVDKQPFLDAFQKRTYHIQHLKDEVLKSIDGFPNNNEGYFAPLKRLKYTFGNHTLVADATIKVITNSKQLPEKDSKDIANFYQSLSSCLKTTTRCWYIFLAPQIHHAILAMDQVEKLPIDVTNAEGVLYGLISQNQRAGSIFN